LADGAKKASERIVIVNRIGMSMQLYNICDIAVVCGSFIDSVGGHNITEPSFYGKPVVYGPHVYKQLGFHEMSQENRAGLQCAGESLPEVLLDLAEDAEKAHEIGCNGRKMIEQSHGVARRAMQDIVRRVEHL
jgi:3-deoxy-D-manno-octulosonic-acid transferase